MAIVEVAKYSHSESSESKVAENTRASCPMADTIISNGKSDLLNDNGNTYSGCIPDVHIDKSAESHTEGVGNDVQVDENSSQCKPNMSLFEQFVVKTSQTILSDACSTPWMESNAEVAEVNKDSNSDPNNLNISTAEINNTVFQSDRRSLHRKKLYSGRDSPVDLMRIRRSSINHINKPKKSLHPALDPIITATRKWSLFQKRKINERKRQNRSKLISEKLGRINSNSQEFQNDSQTLSSVSDPKNIIRRSQRLKDTRRNEPVLSKYRELSDSDGNVVGKENLVSSSNGATNITTLESKQDAEAAKDNLTSLQKGEILVKHVEKDTPIGTKYPVVRLERISPSEIKKHTSNRSTVGETVISPLQNTIRLTRRSVTNIQLPRKSLRSMDTNQPSDKTCNSKLLVSCQVQNVHKKHLDCNQSYVLLRECKHTESSFMNSSAQDILHNIANSNSYNSSSGKSQKNKNLEEWKENNISYVQAQIKTPKQKLANGLRRGIFRRRAKKQGKNGLNEKEIKAFVLERTPQENLSTTRRYTRNSSNEKKKNETEDSALKKPASIDTSTTKLTTGTLKTDSNKRGLRVGMHAYHSQQFEQKKTMNPIKRAMSDVSTFSRAKDNKRHRTIEIVSSDEEAEFIKLLQSSRSIKRQRTENEIKHSNVTVANIVDTTDGESDVFVNDDNRESSLEVRSTARRKANRAGLRKKALRLSRTLGEYASRGTELTRGIFTSTRVNRKSIPPVVSSTREMSSSPIMVDSRMSMTLPTRNNPNMKGSRSEVPEKFEHGKRISENEVRDSLTPRMPPTCLRFQTRLYDSDTE